MKPIEADWTLARTIHHHFSGLPGAEHIATEFALAHLSRLLRRIQPRSVLEIGAGIGTITRLLLEHPARVERIVSTEPNEFCRSALTENIPDDPRWTLVRLPGEVEPAPHDLVIFDGHDGVERAYPMLQAGAVCFVEGIRKPTRDSLNDHLGTRGLACTFDSFIRPSRLRLSRSRKWLGFIPKVKFRTHKGCHIGIVQPITSL